MSQELKLPAFFEQAAELVTEEHIAEAIVCGPDANKHLDKIQEFADAGYECIYIHQVGPDQEGFLGFYGQEILPNFQRQGVSAD